MIFGLCRVGTDPESINVGFGKFFDERSDPVDKSGFIRIPKRETVGTGLDKWNACC